MSFSDHNLLVVRLRPSVCLSINFLHFRDLLKKNTGPISTNLTQSTLGQRGFKVVKIIDYALFQGGYSEIIENV